MNIKPQPRRVTWDGLVPIAAALSLLLAATTVAQYLMWSKSIREMEVLYGDTIELRYIGDPSRYHGTGPSVSEYLRSAGFPRTIECEFLTRRLMAGGRAIRLVRVGTLRSPGGFPISSGARGKAGPSPWD